MELQSQNFNLKQREMFAKLLAQAKERVQVDLENDYAIGANVEAELLPKLAEESGATELIAKTRKLEKELEETEAALSKLGFKCEGDSVSLKYNAPESLSNAMDAAKRSARQERDKVLKKYDRAILGIWASEDAQEAKKIVEELL